MIAVGVDVGKAFLEVAVHGERGVQRHKNTPAGIACLVKQLSKRSDVRIVVEATGGYEAAVLDACARAGLWIARVIPRERLQIDAALKALLDARATPAIRSGKGMGPMFQATTLALLPELGRLNRQEIAKLAGVALYMATLLAVRWDAELRAHYQKLRAQGKVAKAALVACMRKLLCIVNARRRDELRCSGGLAWAA